MAGRWTAGITGAALVAAAAVATGAEAAPAAPTFDGPAEIAEAPDFATQEFADPWDYANVEDQRTDDHGPIAGDGAHGEFAAVDRFRLVAPNGAQMAMVFPGFGGALPAGRDGAKHPVPADAYTHLAIRLKVPAANPGSILFHTCRSATSSCQDFAGVYLDPGWRTYIVDLAARPAWSGNVYALRLGTGDVPGEGVHEIDWIRLYRDTGDVTVHAASGATVYWDLDDDRSNNTPDGGDWGVVGTAAGGSVAFPAAAYPGGTYRFYAEDGSGASPYSEPLTIDDAPLTTITDPDEQGGDDYISVTTGDPWDMSQPTDALRLQNVKDVTWTGGQLHATNQPQQVGGGQVIGNPIVELRMGPALAPHRYHRLTVETGYDGRFDLSFECGGGMHGRLRWWHGGEMHVSREMVLYSDRDTYTWDLITDPPNDINESDNDARDHGWIGGLIDRIWWDANEDPCERRWRLDEIALRADDDARGSFGIDFHDDAHDPGTTVSLYRDTDRVGFDGTPIAHDIPQVAGANTHRWWTYGLPAGSWWLYAEADDGTSVSRRYASGPVVTDGRPRVSGPDRIATAVGASVLAFPDGADAAVVALDRNFPDALAASAVAAAAQGPTLLNSRTSLHPEVRAELERLGVSTVYLMGGESAQTAEVETALGRIEGVTVERLGGADRSETAAAAGTRAVQLWQDAGDGEAGEDVLLALGSGFADALAASQLAGHDRRPLLLVGHDDVPEATSEALAAMGAERLTIVGGSAAVRDDVAAQLEADGYEVARLEGSDRYATAAAVADAAVAAGAAPGVVTVASGQAFPDALAAGPAAVADGGVLLLTRRTSLPAPTRTWLDARPPVAMLKVVGGPAAVDDPTVDALTAAAS